MFEAALFDLDGVVFNTEEQYSVFWGSIGNKYFPTIRNFEQRIKGMTLVQIYDQYFPQNIHVQRSITSALEDFESRMTFEYICGFEHFLARLRKEGLKTAVVTSSNRDKMEVVYKKHPDFQSNFDLILTSEDFERSKPSPDCYLKAASHFGLQPEQCVGFEDSINGLKAVKSAGMYCIGLITTNPSDIVLQYADAAVNNYLALTEFPLNLAT